MLALAVLCGKSVPLAPFLPITSPIQENENLFRAIWSQSPGPAYSRKALVLLNEVGLFPARVHMNCTFPADYAWSFCRFSVFPVCHFWKIAALGSAAPVSAGRGLHPPKGNNFLPKMYNFLTDSIIDEGCSGKPVLPVREGVTCSLTVVELGPRVWRKVSSIIVRSKSNE